MKFGGSVEIAYQAGTMSRILLIRSLFRCLAGKILP
jgi:hypothetical protein